MKLKHILVVVLLASVLLGFSEENPSKATIAITGTVVDKTSKEPLTGIKITIDGTTLSTYTDFDGNFTLLLPTQKQPTLKISGMSYNNETITIENNKPVNSLSIELSSL